MIKKWCISSSILLGLAIFDWPYDYYVFLRFFVSIVAGFVAYAFFQSNNVLWGWVFVVVTYLFNPFFPVYLDKGQWVVIDIISSGLFFYASYLNNQSTDKI